MCMWECRKCNYKNNNSSKTCHGDKCNGMRESDAVAIPLRLIPSKKKVKKLYDFCPACGKDMFFTPTRWKGKKAWSCESGKHRPCNFTGKSKPIPEVMINDEIR